MRLPTRRGAGRVFMCLACFSTVLRGQESSSHLQPAFKSGVDVVQVDVSVLDKDRRPVRGLTTADFTILENGKPQPILAFSTVNLPEAETAAAGASWLRDVSRDVTTNDVRPEGRLVVIMFDWSIRFADQALARRIATAAVNRLGPGDLAAVVFTSAVSNAGTPQNFTADRARLLAAINRPFAPALENGGGITGDRRNKNGVMLDDPEGYESGDCYCRMCVAEAIARVGDAVRDVQGRRKTLLFIGTYFRSYESLQGTASMQDAGLAKNGPRVERPSARPGVCSAFLKDARDKMVRATSLANLAIHVLDPVGIETESNSPLGGSIAGQLERRDDLSVLADLTGGRAVLNTNAPQDHVAAILDESHSYYLLAFAPADRNAKGKFHKIEVKVDRPGVSVRTRAGYYTGETHVKGTAPNLMSPATAAVIEGVLPRTDVPLSVTVAPFAMPGKAESAVAIVLGVEQHTPANAAGSNGPVRVLAAAFDRDGRSARSEEQTIGRTRTANGGVAQYEVLSRLALEPGRYEVRVAFDAGPAERASVYTYVDVPDFAREPLSLSGIVLHVDPAILSAPRDAFTNLLPLVPTARRDFARTDRALAFVRVYQKGENAVQPVDVNARIEDAAGRSVLNDAASVSSDRFGVNSSADYQVDLPIDRLQPGEYLLTIEAAQGKYTARRGMRFTVGS
jgi:VWFA-related protein